MRRLNDIEVWHENSASLVPSAIRYCKRSWYRKWSTMNANEGECLPKIVFLFVSPLIKHSTRNYDLNFGFLRLVRFSWESLKNKTSKKRVFWIHFTFVQSRREWAEFVTFAFCRILSLSRRKSPLNRKKVIMRWIFSIIRFIIVDNSSSLMQFIATDEEICSFENINDSFSTKLIVCSGWILTDFLLGWWLNIRRRLLFPFIPDMCDYKKCH